MAAQRAGPCVLSLGRAASRSGGSASPLECRQHIVPEHRQPQPRRVGSEAIRGKHARRQIVLQHIVDALGKTERPDRTNQRRHAAPGSQLFLT